MRNEEGLWDLLNREKAGFWIRVVTLFIKG